jgi:hypothetical protein
MHLHGVKLVFGHNKKQVGSKLKESKRSLNCFRATHVMIVNHCFTYTFTFHRSFCLLTVCKHKLWTPYTMEFGVSRPGSKQSMTGRGLGQSLSKPEAAEFWSDVNQSAYTMTLIYSNWQPHYSIIILTEGKCCHWTVSHKAATSSSRWLILATLCTGRGRQSIVYRNCLAIARKESYTSSAVLIFQPTIEKLTGGWSKLHNDELRNEPFARYN